MTHNFLEPRNPNERRHLDKARATPSLTGYTPSDPALYTDMHPDEHEEHDLLSAGSQQEFEVDLDEAKVSADGDPQLYEGLDDQEDRWDKASTLESVYSYQPQHAHHNTGGAGHAAPHQLSARGNAVSSASVNSVEDQTQLFEDILHPEMVEALDSLAQLDYEEGELLKQMTRIYAKYSISSDDREFVQALSMELDLRRREKIKTMETFRRIEQERGENTRALVREMKGLRTKNRDLMKTLSKRDQRQEGNFTFSDVLDVYDWVVDILLLGDLAKEGWKVAFSPKFYEHMRQTGHMQEALMGSPDAVDPTSDRAMSSSNGMQWSGAVIAVVGLYDKGKTFVLNQITKANLPSGKKVSTKGLSFKHVNVDESSFVLLDSAGSYSPVRVVNELSVAQKEATELFLLDLIFDLSDYFICVVNDFTSLDQRYLDKLTRSLQNSPKVFREVIVVHNLKEVTSSQVLAHVWETQVTQIYSGGQRMSTQVAAINPATGKLEEKQVEWFKTKFSRHICLAHEDSPVGNDVNPWSISLLRYWLKSVFVPVDREFSVVNSVIHHANKKLSMYFKEKVRLGLFPGASERIKFIRPVGNINDGQFRLPQVALDASGLMLTRPDSFAPPCDIVIQNGEYNIYLDVPGMSAKDITLARQNVMTIIKGKRTIPYANTEIVEKQERKYGDFTMTFTIPHAYERKWRRCSVADGVLNIAFGRDNDDGEQALPQHFASQFSSSNDDVDSDTRVADPNFKYSPSGPADQKQ